MTAPGTPVVELFLAGVWTDISQYVKTSAGINISRGRADEQSSPATATCTLVLINDGRFSPTNTTGAYYPNLTLGTLLRVTYLSSVRFIGAVYEWPVSWAAGVNDVNRVATIVANGVRRRLQQNVALASPYRRAILGESNIVGYWPMEDGSGATQFAPVIGTAPGSFASMTLAGDSTWPASLPLPTMGSSSSVASFTFNQYNPAAGGQQLRWLFKCQMSAGAVSWTGQVHTSGAHMFEVDYFPVADQWQIKMINQNTGVTEYDSTPITGPWQGNGAQSRASFQLKQNGTGIDYRMETLNPGSTVGEFFAATIPSATLGLITGFNMFNANTMNSTVGHLTLENQQTGIFDISDALDGYAGETAYTRAARLANEEGIAIVRPSVTGSTFIGPQSEIPVIQLIDEAADVDGGLSSEDVGTYAVYWRGRTAIMGAAPTLTIARTDMIDVTTTYDDNLVLNDVTVARPLGSSARSVATTGNRGTTAIGTYADSVSLNLYRDADLQTAADARRAAGQMDEPRLPSIRFDALGTVGVTGPKAIREGDTVTVTGMQAGSGIASSVTYLLVGWKETITYSNWFFDLNTQPHPLARTFVLDSATLGILDVDRLGY